MAGVAGRRVSIVSGQPNKEAIMDHDYDTQASF
jgi:hypothetical protein